MEDLFKKTKPQHFDRFLTNIQFKGLFNVLVPKKSRAGFKSHFSKILADNRMSYAPSVSSPVTKKV